MSPARQLNDIVESVFPQDAVFRIDHCLGKETVQNILALRFANQLFEPLWNAKYVDHVQITMAEDIGTGVRAGYYDGVGAPRNVIQNHLLQLLALTAMEDPSPFNACEDWGGWSGIGWQSRCRPFHPGGRDSLNAWPRTLSGCPFIDMSVCWVGGRHLPGPPR